MSRFLGALGLWCLVAACAGASSDEQSGPGDPAVRRLPPDQRDVTLLGREVFELVDRAMAYKGSHRGRPPRTLRQMGVESLAPLVVRRIAVVSDSPVVTVAFRDPRGRRVAACEGTPQILEEAVLNGGRFTLMCATPSGAIVKQEVKAP